MIPATSSEEQERKNAENQAQGVVEKFKKDKKENNSEADDFWRFLHHNLERENYDLSQTNLKIITSEKLN